MSHTLMKSYPSERRKSALAEAFAKAQAEIHNPPLDSTNPHFRSKFASLAAVRNAIVPVAAKHGIAVVQELTTQGNAVSCLTHLYHAEGDRLSFGPFTVTAEKATAHGLGSAATYARRYSLQAVFCIVGDEDDDGNAAVTPSEAAEGTIAVGRKPPPAEEVERALTALQSASDLAAFKEAWTGLSKDVRQAIGKEKFAELKSNAAG